MSKKKLISIIISAILTIITAILGCVYGVKVDFSGIDVDIDDGQCSVICYEQTHEQP